jgi:dihydrofolate reductase
MKAQFSSAEVYIAASLDGYIARPDGDIGWLVGQPVPDGEDFGHAAFMDGVGAIVMGRQTFVTVRGFSDWPYAVPVVVMSRTPSAVIVPDDLRARVSVTAAAPEEILGDLAAQGARRIYVDGGQVVRAFLQRRLVRRLIVTLIPVLIGTGRPLWGHGDGDLPLTLGAVRHWPNGFVQVEYVTAS